MTRERWRHALRALEIAACTVLGACARAGSGPERAYAGAPMQAARLGPDALLARGIALLQAGDGLRAEQYLTLAVRAGADESRAIAPLVRACAGSARLQSALEHALPYLRRHPDAWRLRYMVAALQLALGRTQLALAELEQVRRAQPRAAQAHYLAAVIARDQLHDAQAASAGFSAYVRTAPHGEHAAEARAWLRERPTAEPGGGP